MRKLTTEEIEQRRQQLFREARTGMALQKMKVKRLINGARQIVYTAMVPDRGGNYQQFTQAEVEKALGANGKFEICEGTVTAAGPGIQREVTALYEGNRESQNGVKHSLKVARFSPVSADELSWNRTEPDGRSLIVNIAADGAWTCQYSKTVPHAKGKDCKVLESHLYSEHPVAPSQESFRHRLTEAFQALGYTGREARIASREDETALFDAWTLVTGSREAAAHAKGERKIHPRHQQLLDEVLGKKK